MMRVLLLTLVVLALAPGTWLRDADHAPDNSQFVDSNPLGFTGRRFGALTIEGAWQLDSPNDRFGSYSGLLAIDGNRLVAGSDMGMILEMPMPQAIRGENGAVRIDTFAGKSSHKKALVDIESLTRDPATGRIWVGYEGTNSIERYQGDLTGRKVVEPPEMAHWPSNSGPEAMARLDDGRFLVLSEGRVDWLGDRFPGLLFRSDPVEGGKPAQFSFEAPAGYRPVDMAPIPDGRVLIVFRKFQLGVPPRFETLIGLADPDQIEPSKSMGKPWSVKVLSALTEPGLADNYEGLAVVSAPDGTLTLWLISDDNNSAFQRTLLLKARFDPAVYTVE